MTTALSSVAPPATEGYRLDDLYVAVATRRVLRGGNPVAVTGLSFDLLLALARAAPSLVTFDALMEQVWPGIVVSPETLTQRVKLLRQALGDSAENPRYILAVRGHGYRLLATAVPSAEPSLANELPRRSARRWLHLAIPAVVLFVIGGLAVRWHFAPLESGPAPDPDEGYSYFLQAESVVNGTSESFVAAIALYDEALARDPGIARAYSGRAMNRAALVWNGSRLARGLENAQADAERALELDASDARAHSALASIHALRGEWSAAERNFRAAIAANPEDTDTLGRYAVSLLLSTGRLREAEAQASAAQRAAPDSGFAAAVRAFVAHARGDDEEAVNQSHLSAARGGDPRQVIHVHASAAARRGKYTEAAEQSIQALPPALLDAGGAGTIRQAYAALESPSQRPAALNGLRKLIGQPAWERTDPRGRQPVLYLLAAFGAIDELYHEMSQLLRRGDDDYPEIIAIAMLWSPEMRPLRQDPRFPLLVERLGLLSYWREAGPPDGCELSSATILCP